MDTTIKDLMDNLVVNELEGIGKLQAGSEDREREIKGLERLYRLSIDEYKIEAEMYNEDRRMEREMEIREAEVKIREKELEFEERKSWRNWMPTAITCGSSILLTGIVIYCDKHDSYVIPNSLMRFVHKLPFK